MGANKKLGITKEQRFVAKRYASRFRLSDHKLIIVRSKGRRTLYLEGTDTDGVMYKVRYDKVKLMRRPSGNRQVVNKVHYLQTECDKVHGKDRYSFPNVTNDMIVQKLKIPVMCETHGIFHKRKSSLINDREGCPICSKKRYNKNRKYFKHEDRVD